MIEHLTIDKLIAYGFISADVENFQQLDNFELMFHKTINELFWATNIERKIYSGIDAYHIYYFRSENSINFPYDELSLIPEYFGLKRKAFLSKRKQQAGAVYNEELSKGRFKDQEIERTALEIENSKKEIINPKDAVSKIVTVAYRERMEIYLDWLSTWVEPEITRAPQPSILKYLKQIPKLDYFHVHINDDETMSYYLTALKKLNDKLSLNTNIYELPILFSINENWNNILAIRLKNAPDETLAQKAFKKDLSDLVIYDNDSSDDAPVNKDRYWNKYRKVAYEYVVKGEMVTLKHLGYLILKYQCGRPEGEEIIESISTIFDIKRVVNSIAEGAAVALFIHHEIDRKHGQQFLVRELFKPGYNAEDYLNLLKNSEYIILNSKGEYIYGEKKKSVITAFFDILERNGIIHYHSPSKLAPLINQLIPNLNISSRTLQSNTSKLFEMKAYFESLINTL
ncbi:hypothetical protein ACFQ3S_05940 [Mucilaginibacter terrae]|uniref:hypothetical protein n=1 Tax=Mucilaginibacter terrae TaxID=1955052 RepID=UPI0036284D8C